MPPIPRSALLAALLLCAVPGRSVADTNESWWCDAVWYQIFPERFRNGDPRNDPTRESLEWPVLPGAGWRTSPWTGDWYARDTWETAMGPDFYGHGVFERRYGGDLQGVIDKLPYLADLGITALYFNPVFHARSLHKYDGSSFHHIDPYFGPDPAGDLAIIATETADPASWKWTAADKLFLELIKQARAKGMRVVIDGVFNHTGRDFFAFRNLMEQQQQSPYKDWYIVREWDNPATARNEFRYAGWWGHGTLPEFANSPDNSTLADGPRDYIFAATRRWMDPDGNGDPADGIDGWRLDVADEIPMKFWAEWNALVHRINPRAFTAAEKWDEADAFLRECGFTSVMNYFAFSIPIKGFLIDNTLRPAEFSRWLDGRRQVHPEATQFALWNLMDSHDTERLASTIVNRGEHIGADAARRSFDDGGFNNLRANADYKVSRPDADSRAIQRMVTLFQMTYLGTPMIYYGSEAGMWGADDPDDRQPMVWDDLQYAPQKEHPFGRSRSDELAFDRDLHAFYRAAIALRHRRPELRRGVITPAHSDDTGNTYGFTRTLAGTTTHVLFNRSEETRKIVLAGAASATNVLFTTTPGGGGVEVTATGGDLTVTLPRLTGAVVSPAP